MHSYLELERIRHTDDNVLQFGACKAIPMEYW